MTGASLVRMGKRDAYTFIGGNFATQRGIERCRPQFEQMGRVDLLERLLEQRRQVTNAEEVVESAGDSRAFEVAMLNLMLLQARGRAVRNELVQLIRQVENSMEDVKCES